MARTKAPAPVASPPRLHVVVMMDVAETFFREVVAGAAQYGREVGDWQVHLLRGPEERMEGQDWKAHGVIACLNDARVAEAAAAFGVPIVAIGSIGLRDSTTAVSHVDTDNDRLAAMVFEHLRERGLTHYGYYGASPEPATLWSGIRGACFAACVTAAGYRCAELAALDRDAASVESQQALQRWLVDLPKPVGIMACSDLHARRVLEACRSAGLRVPYDVAVVGVDNDELECELAVPSLTSIAQAARRIGHEAARILDHCICPDRFAGQSAGAAVPLVTLIPPPAIFTRASTETFAVADPVIAKVIEAVRDRACRGLTITDVVGIAGLPRWRLERLFKRAVGHSIHDDIVRVRLAEARRLIRSTDLPLKVVAKRSGFHSVTYMTTLFRRRFGTTPALFRRLEQGSVVRSPQDGDEAAG